MIFIAGYKYIGNAITDSDDTFYIRADYLYSTIRTDDELQAMLDAYDPLSEAKAEAAAKSNKAAGKARAKYATDIPFQTEAYNAKLADAKAFKAAGYPESDLAGYQYTNARATRQSTTGQAAADYIIAIAAGWDGLMFAIENKRDAANEQIEALTDWQQCKILADTIIAEFEAM